MGKNGNQRTWTNKDLIKALENSITKSGICRKLGLTVHAGNFKTIDKYIKTLGLDTSHLKGRGHGKSGDGLRIPDERVFTENSYYATSRLYKRLLKRGRENKCEICRMPPKWKGKKLRLQVDHINGDAHDHRLSNLRILCPNCHSQTKTFSR